MEPCCEGSKSRSEPCTVEDREGRAYGWQPAVKSALSAMLMVRVEGCIVGGAGSGCRYGIREVGLNSLYPAAFSVIEANSSPLTEYAMCGGQRGSPFAYHEQAG